MTYMISYETINMCLPFMGMLFLAAIICEWLPDKDMKLFFQFIAFITNSAVGIVCGWAFFTNNIIYTQGMTMQYEPLGGVLAIFGVLCFMLFIITLLPRILHPYDHAGSAFQQSPKALVKPRKPGMI